MSWSSSLRQRNITKTRDARAELLLFVSKSVKHVQSCCFVFKKQLKKNNCFFTWAKLGKGTSEFKVLGRVVRSWVKITRG